MLNSIAPSELTAPPSSSLTYIVQLPPASTSEAPVAGSCACFSLPAERSDIAGLPLRAALGSRTPRILARYPAAALVFASACAMGARFIAGRAGAEGVNGRVWDDGDSAS